MTKDREDLSHLRLAPIGFQTTFDGMMIRGQADRLFKFATPVLVALLFSFFGLDAQERTVGVFINSQASFDGYTLFAPMSGTETFLIDNCGYEINSWSSSFRPGLSAYLLENGELLRTARISSTFNGGGSGGRIERFDWDGNELWSLNYSDDTVHQHHDIEPLPNGNFLILAWEVHTREEALEAGINPDLLTTQVIWSEQIVEMKPFGISGGEIVWEWHLWDHLIQDFDSQKSNFGDIEDHPELFDINFQAREGQIPGADWIHANGIDYNPQLDQIVISTRNISEIWIIDHSTTSEEAAGHTGGNAGRGGDFLFRWGNPEAYGRGTDVHRAFYAQHDARWIPEGHPNEGSITVFNNGVLRPEGNFSSVDMITPVWDEEDKRYMMSQSGRFLPDTIQWTYDGDQQFQFFATNICGAESMPNGNMLVCIGTNGHIIEVNEFGNPVWEYVSPISAGNPVEQGDPIFSNNLFRSSRFGADYPAFEGRDLTPGDLIEIDPEPADCTLFRDTTTSISRPLSESSLTLLENPVADRLKILNPESLLLNCEVLDLAGRRVAVFKGSDDFIDFDVSHLVAGVYVLVLNPASESRLSVSGRSNSPISIKVVKQ